jgi:exodeoxyribonuclease VIII
MSIAKITDEQYFALTGVSNSLLSRLAKCPAAMNIKTETTPAMLIGTLAHCCILDGREEFYNRYAVADSMDKRTKEGKAAWAAFCEENPGKTIITMDQLETVVGMADSIANHPACQNLLQNGTAEVAVTWDEAIDGEVIPCKAKADYISPMALIDLKSTTNAEYNMFSKSVMNFKYCNQMSWYLRGLKANGVFSEAAIIIAVETKAPFLVGVYQLSDEMLEYGEAQAMYLLKQYVKIKDMEVLPSYNSAGIQSLRLPAWLAEVE